MMLVDRTIVQMWLFKIIAIIVALFSDDKMSFEVHSLAVQYLRIIYMSDCLKLHVKLLVSILIKVNRIMGKENSDSDSWLT